MALRLAHDPIGGAALVRAGIDRLVARGSDAPLAAQSVDLLSPHVGSPHAVFDLAGGDIARGAGLETARGGAARYIVSSTAGAVAAVEVLVDAANTATRLTTINFGPFVSSTARGFDDVAQLESVQRGSFEATMLRCATVGLVAIWLKADNDAADILYPVAPAPDEITPRTAYSEQELLARIRPAAQALIDVGRPGSVP